MDAKQMAKWRDKMRVGKEKRDKGLFSDQRAPVSKKSSQSHKNYDWTASYDTTSRPKIYSDQDATSDPNPDNKPVIVRDLEGELDEGDGHQRPIELVPPVGPVVAPAEPE